MSVFSWGIFLLFGEKKNSKKRRKKAKYCQTIETTKLGKRKKFKNKKILEHML
jgi:hypothetical protein